MWGFRSRVTVRLPSPTLLRFLGILTVLVMIGSKGGNFSFFHKGSHEQLEKLPIVTPHGVCFYRYQLVCVVFCTLLAWVWGFLLQ